MRIHARVSKRLVGNGYMSVVVREGIHRWSFTGMGLGGMGSGGGLGAALAASLTPGVSQLLRLLLKLPKERGFEDLCYLATPVFLVDFDSVHRQRSLKRQPGRVVRSHLSLCCHLSKPEREDSAQVEQERAGQGWLVGGEILEGVDAESQKLAVHDGPDQSRARQAVEEGLITNHQAGLRYRHGLETVANGHKHFQLAIEDDVHSAVDLARPNHLIALAEAARLGVQHQLQEIAVTPV